MKSKIEKYLKLEFSPIAVIFSDNKPEESIQFQPEKWGCVMSMFAHAIKGKTIVFDKDSYGCLTGGMALGFGNHLDNYPGGKECFYHFLSYGKNEDGKDNSQPVIHGERYLKNPKIVKKRYDNNDIFRTNSKYVIFKPIDLVNEQIEKPEIIIFPVNANQLSALVFLSHFDRTDNDAVYAPFGAGCQTIGMFVIAERKRKLQRALIGLTDPSARVFSANIIGTSILTFAMTYEFFNNLESNVDNSFLSQKTWNKLIQM